MLAGRWARGNLNKPVYASVNSGEEWFESSDGLFDVATAPNHERPEVTMIRYSLAQPGLVFATTRTRVPSVNVQDGTIPTGVFRSVDGGVTWQHRSNGLPRYGADHAHAGVAAIALHPQLAGVAWALTEEWNPVTREYTSRVFKTEDGGLAWQSASSNLPVGWYGALLVEPQRPDYLYVGGAQGVFFSSDAGERWTKLGQRQLRMVRSLEVGADHVFAGGSQSVHRIARPHHLDPVFRSGFESGDPN